MMSISAPLPIYNKRIEDLSADRIHLKNKQNGIAWGRFVCIVVMAISLYYAWPFGVFYTVLTVIVFMAVFLRLVILSAKNNEKIGSLDRLLLINQQEIDMAAGQYISLPDGHDFLPNNHDYALDLDIFGRASLYQYVNRTISAQGQHDLSAWLLHPADPVTVLQRQEAARELKDQYVWRQQLQAHGMENQITLLTRKKLALWLEDPNRFTKPHWKWISILLPAIIIAALIFHLTGSLSSERFYGLVILFLFISWFFSHKVKPAYIKLNQVVAEMTTLSNTIHCIEQNHFKSPLLSRLQQAYVYTSSKASLQVKSLKAILDRLDYRLNPIVFIPLNIFLLWDLQQVLSLENGKKKQ